MSHLSGVFKTLSEKRMEISFKQIVKVHAQRTSAFDQGQDQDWLDCLSLNFLMPRQADLSSG